MKIFSDTVNLKPVPSRRAPVGRYIRETRTPKEKLQDTINTVIAFVLMIIAAALVVLLVFLFYENLK